MRPSRLGAALAGLFVAALASAPIVSAARPPFVENSAKLQTPQTDGRISWRTYSVDDTPSLLYNVSTVAAPRNYKNTTGMGMYGYNFFWRGPAYNPSRPLLIHFGSSNTRCSNISDLACVINKGTQEGFIWRLRTQGNYSRAMLNTNQAGMGVLSIVTPLCFNTTLSTPIGAVCTRTTGNHILRHYRPEIVIDLLKQIQALYGFDPNKVVGVGTSMGGRGMLRLGTQFPLRAMSITAGNLEISSSWSMKSSPWNGGNCGEMCWNMSLPSVTNVTCKQKSALTLPLANKLANTNVQIYGSPGDTTSNLTASIIPSCDAINRAAVAAGRSNTSCTVNVISAISDTNRAAPSHNDVCAWGYDPEDLNWIIAGYGGKPVNVADNGNVTYPYTSISDVGPPSTTTTTTTTTSVPTVSTTTVMTTVDAPTTTAAPPSATDVPPAPAPASTSTDAAPSSTDIPPPTPPPAPAPALSTTAPAPVDPGTPTPTDAPAPTNTDIGGSSTDPAQP
ncbi:hypothetical protein OC834_005702 [Tilletia horrida]|nr:hypothetical protein OC834_005702 [Tilletia horrida]